MFLSDRKIYELLEGHYSHYPHYKEIQEAIWELFERQEHLWFADIRTIAGNLSLDVPLVRGYISLITESNDKPQLLNQLFYQLDENGQLKLIELSTEDLFVLALATLETTSRRIKEKLEEINNKFGRETTANWLKSTFTCWQDIMTVYKPKLDASFNNPNNSLWAVLQRY